MNPYANETQRSDRLGAMLRSAAASIPPHNRNSLAARFAARLREVAAHPERVPIRVDGAAIESRAGGTILAAALKNGVRLMHVCGARTLCSTCRVKVEVGAEHLSPMTT